MSREHHVQYRSWTKNKKANQIIKENGIYKDGKRQAFGVVFEPQYKKNGELKDFKYVRSAWFDENKVK